MGGGVKGNFVRCHVESAEKVQCKGKGMDGRIVYCLREFRMLSSEVDV